MTEPEGIECIIDDQDIAESMDVLRLTEEKFIVCSVIITAIALIFVGIFIQ